MGLFSTNKYPTAEHYLSREEIKRILRRVNVKSPNVTETEEGMVESLIIENRHGDGKISLQQIWNILTRLKTEYKISEPDRRQLMEAFVAHFSHKTAGAA